jgi:hypothetical protein
VIASLVERGHVHIDNYIHVAASGSCYATMRSPDGVLYELRSSDHSTHRLNLAFDATSADGVEESLRLSAEYERRAAERLVEEKLREEKRAAAWEAMDDEHRAAIWHVSGIKVGKAGPKYIRRGGFHREQFVRAMDSWIAEKSL